MFERLAFRLLFFLQFHPRYYKTITWLNYWEQLPGWFSGQLIRNFEIKFVCFVVAMSDLVHDVEATC